MHVDAPVGASGLAALLRHRQPTLRSTWSDLEWLLSMTPAARRWSRGSIAPTTRPSALAAGARGVIVSNHGGRQLDSVPATLDVLPAIAEAVDGQAACCSTAASAAAPMSSRRWRSAREAVLIGRPMLCGLAAGGDTGFGSPAAAAGRASKSRWPCAARPASPICGSGLTAHQVRFADRERHRISGNSRAARRRQPARRTSADGVHARVPHHPGVRSAWRFPAIMLIANWCGLQEGRRRTR